MNGWLCDCLVDVDAVGGCLFVWCVCCWLDGCLLVLLLDWLKVGLVGMDGVLSPHLTLEYEPDNPVGWLNEWMIV